MRVAFAGTGTLGMRLFEALLDSRHEVVALVQNGRKAAKWQMSLYPRLAGMFFPMHTVMGLARYHRIPILFIDKMTEDELAPLRALQPDLLLVGGFGIILKEPILTLPRLGCLNTHSALLPRHRGPNPFTAVILQNEAETGVTFHVMDPGIDTGDIVEQVRMPITDRMTAGQIYRDTSQLAGEHVVRVLDRIEREGLHGTPQDAALATYQKKLTWEEARIDWSKPAEEVDRLIRACAPFTVAHFRRRGRTIYAYRSEYRSDPVEAAPGTVLQVRPKLKVATGLGTVALLHTYALRPVPWFWPSPWSRPRVGERLE